MATRFKSVIALLAAVMVVATAACAGDPPVPTPNIDETVESKVKQEVAAQPTATPVMVVKEVVPTDTPIPTDTPVRTAAPTTQIPSSIATPYPTATPTTVPAPTPVPTATPTRVPTVTPTHVPTPTPVSTPTEEDRYETEADSAPAIGNTQVGEITIGELPLDWEWLSGGLKRYTSVFGVNVFATSDTPDDKLVHSVNVLAEYLDNDADGLVDNELVLQALLSVNASLIMSDTEDDFDRSLDELPERFHESVEDGDILFVALFADEVPPNEGPDASLEEILHLITQAGYARAYPDAFGEEKGSEIANYMDVARGGHFAEGDPSDCEDDPDENWATGQCAIPPNGVYPDDAWYTYTDTTCSYDCMITEYTYWAITSVLGAQANKCDDIADEWVLCTASQVESRDNGVYRLLGDTSFALPTRIPKGDYDYTKIEVEH